MARPDPVSLQELFGWLRIPSISADPAHAADVRAAGEWICRFLRRAGGRGELVKIGESPLAVGELRASEGGQNAPTVLLYGHFDVQPPGELELWDSPPFEPQARNGWIYGRGAADDKGNFFLLLKAAELLARERKLPVNVRVACDGEEETGGDAIIRFLELDERGADACIIFDGHMPRRGTPAFVVGTRGLCYYHLRVRTGLRDLHSGVYGGAALNALHALNAVLSALAALPGELRAGATPPTDEELAAWSELDPGNEALAAQGARPSDEHAAEDFYLRTFARPSVDVNGIRGGEAALVKTVLPVEAEANVSIRIAPGQNAHAIDEVARRVLRDAAPPGAELEIESLAPPSRPALVPPDTPAVQLALDAFQRVLGRRPLLVRSGGTLPIVPALVERGIPVILTGFDLPEGNVHAPNERLLAEYLPLGIAAARETLVALGQLEESGVDPKRT